MDAMARSCAGRDTFGGRPRINPRGLLVIRWLSRASCSWLTPPARDRATRLTLPVTGSFATTANALASLSKTRTASIAKGRVASGFPDNEPLRKRRNRVVKRMHLPRYVKM